MTQKSVFSEVELDENQTRVLSYLLDTVQSLIEINAELKKKVEVLEQKLEDVPWEAMGEDL